MRHSSSVAAARILSRAVMTCGTRLERRSKQMLAHIK
jgi:hypothetical protein